MQSDSPAYGFIVDHDYHPIKYNSYYYRKEESY